MECRNGRRGPDDADRPFHARDAATENARSPTRPVLSGLSARQPACSWRMTGDGDGRPCRQIDGDSRWRMTELFREDSGRSEQSELDPLWNSQTVELME